MRIHTLTLTGLLMFPVLSMGCDEDKPQSEPPADTPTEPATDTGDDASGDVDRALLCEANGVFDFSVAGTGFSEFDGRTLWAAAVEPIDSPHTDTVKVLLETQIQEGAFEALCADSLVENYRYPSYAVVIDADGSGDCSPDDLAAVGQFYGWNEDQGFVANAMDGTDQAQGVPVSFERIGDETTWGDLPFCDYYVPKALID